jgi:hypothetical protein
MADQAQDNNGGAPAAQGEGDQVANNVAGAGGAVRGGGGAPPPPHGGGAAAQAAQAGLGADIASQLDAMVQLQANLLSQTTGQFQLSELRRKDEESKAAQARLVREEEEARAKGEAAVQRIKGIAGQESARFALAIARLSGSKDCIRLAQVHATMLGTLEKEGDVDEANSELLAGVQTLTGVSADSKLLLVNELKMRKRKATSASGITAETSPTGMFCSRCQRDSHTEASCRASSTVNGVPLGGQYGGFNLAKRPRYGGGGYGAPPGGYGMQYAQQAPPNPYGAPPAGFANFFPPPVVGLQAPQPPLGPPPMGGQGGYGYGQPLTCFNCYQQGHKSDRCPQPPRQQRPFNPAGVAPGLQPPAAVQAGAGGRVSAQTRGESAQTLDMSSTTLSTQHAAQASGVVEEAAISMVDEEPARASAVTDERFLFDVACADVSVYSNKGERYQDGKGTSFMPGQPSANGVAEVVDHAGKSAAAAEQEASIQVGTVVLTTPSTDHHQPPPSASVTVEDEEDSIATLYGGEWALALSDDEEEGGEPVGQEGSQPPGESEANSACSRSTASAGVVNHAYSSHGDQLYSGAAAQQSYFTTIDSSSKPCGPLHKFESKLSPAQLQQLSTEGTEMHAEPRPSDGGLPAYTQSLRRAIVENFKGKKKILSDEEVAQQECVRCKKRGHTVHGCPDKTQNTTEDSTAEHAWVRALMNAPRVDITIANKGLTLAEGVAAWLARGEVFNRGNPWAKSTRREDALRRRLGYHKAMGMSSVHLGWIGFGVPLEFVQDHAPRPLAFRNHKSTAEEEEFIDKEHETGVADGSYVVVDRAELKGICPLQVVKHPVSGKRRLVQDLRWINGHLPNVPFKMESLHNELGDIVRRGDKLLTTDITKAYYCLAMHPDAQRYLGWEWKGKFYMPTCLVFGLSTAPRVFTKIMRPMMAFMRSLAVRVLGMIDDYLWAEQPENIARVKQAVLAVLPGLGWTLNDKCELTPQDEVLMLGMLINAKLFQVRAPEKKVKAAVGDMELAVLKHEAQQPITIQLLQRITGRLMSMMLAFGGTRVFTRDLYRIIAVALEGNEVRKMNGMRPVYHVQLDRKAIEELEFWLERLFTHNGLRIHCREEQVQMVLWTDASDMGYGGEVAGVTVGEESVAAAERALPEQDVALMAHGCLPKEEIARSSTRRELVGLLKVASTSKVLHQIHGKRILVIMDSIPALRNLIKGGGPVPILNEAVKEWARFCEKEKVEATYEWVERAKNWRADQASKLHYEQHQFCRPAQEEKIRECMKALPATNWRGEAGNNHWRGKVPIFTPMFHHVDARVEMIRSQLEEAVIVVPRWPAGGRSDWYRRVTEHSIARVELGTASAWYRKRPQTGHDDQMEAFWLLGRRGEKKRAALLGCALAKELQERAAQERHVYRD